MPLPVELISVPRGPAGPESSANEGDIKLSTSIRLNCSKLLAKIHHTVAKLEVISETKNRARFNPVARIFGGRGVQGHWGRFN